MNDGVYVEFFAVKDGIRYNAKIVSVRDMMLTLTKGIADGFDKILNDEEADHVSG